MPDQILPAPGLRPAEAEHERLLRHIYASTRQRELEHVTWSAQQKQEFLIHRCTHRTFGEKQWREVASRLETWKSSLVNVLAVIRQQKEEFAKEKEAEAAGPDSRGGQGYRQDRRQRNFIEVE